MKWCPCFSMFYSLFFSLCVLVLGSRKGVMETKVLYGKLRKFSADVFVAQNFSKYLEDRSLSGIIMLHLLHLLL